MHSRTSIIFLVVLILTPMGQLAVDLYIPSLPLIAKDLHTSMSLTQQTVSIYLLALGIGQFIYGPLSDSWGRKNAIFAGTFLFLIGSLLASFAHSIEMLLIARAVQGLGGAAATVLSKVVAVDIYKNQQLTRASAYIGLVWGVSPVIAPAIGGMLEVFSGWRLGFAVLTCYAFIFIILAYFLLEETLPHKKMFHLKSLKK
ncbi:MFS transporter [Piscirickettsia litoralis]|uniref:Major facilitator superfamily (MFS) profile domain-containing protein n=1 Tax=Piscirickettsia litoralis TaxID=1891921 RepID=A0ABX3A0G4_9GAMM|nr:MFS transporter [Piscirickettsia litoralis]ODN41752.1 hypothetical protein BGC07_00580 [Piscirickettsia litoralis]